jgi:biuret amidohydrolase
MPGKTITLLDDEQWPSTGYAFTLPILPESTALGIVDVQLFALDAPHDLAGTLQSRNPELHKAFVGRTHGMINNIQELLKAFRSGKRRVLFTRHGMQVPDGGDLVSRRRIREETTRGTTHRQSGHMPLRGEPAYDIDPRVAPLPTELVFDKNTSSAFNSTGIDLFLRNMKIETLVLTGIASDQCVFATALDAADRGFHVIIAADACSALDQGSAEAVQILFGRVWGYVLQTKDIIEWLETGLAPKFTRLNA